MHRSPPFARLLLLLYSWLASVAHGEETCQEDAVAIPLTSTDALGPFYIPGSPMTDVLVTSPAGALDDPANVFVVRGRIYGHNDCGAIVPLSDVRVEAWYAGEPNDAGEFYQDTDYRGQVMTDACGSFRFTQTFPAVYPARPIPHIHYRLSSTENDGAELLVTQLYFEGAIPSGYDPDNTKIAQVVNEADGSRSAEFDIYLSVPGTADAAACESSSDVEGMEMDVTTMIPSSGTMEPSDGGDDETIMPSTGSLLVLEGDANYFDPPPQAQEGEICGPKVCRFPQVCCNDSCGICTEPGGVCIMRGCVDPTPEEGVVLTTSRTGGGSDLFD